MVVGRYLLVTIVLVAFQFKLFAQCTPPGNETDYGSSGWIGYVYDGANNFTSANYRGRITTVGENFDESFCGDACNIAGLTGTCTTDTETFSVRFRKQKTILAGGCGVYTFTIGGDDGVRLSIDGGATFISNTIYNDHPYATTTATAYLAVGATINMVLEYYENAGQNRVSFSVAGPGVLGWGGVVAGDQNICQSPLNPAAFTSVSPAAFCNGVSPTYLWETSPDNSAWTDISGETSETYDITTGSIGTRYYRRRATNGTLTLYSNTLTVIGDSPLGNPATYPPAGTGWIGYVYDGRDNFSAGNYQGYITEGTTVFNETFCGDNCISMIEGCDIQTETFSVRFRLTLNVATAASYTFTIGADDGVRLSINGGSTYLVSDYGDHGYQTVTSAATDMAVGNYLLVLDYFENGGGNRVSFSYTTGPLPVTWSFFDGYYKDGQNVIEWKTASEKINAGFEVQRSFDGVNFDSIGYVVGNGTTSLPSNYVFRDISPTYGWNYYRLKQMDLDGAVNYSRLIPVHVSTLPESLIYPNPASKEIFVSHPADSDPMSVSLINSATSYVYHLIQDFEQPARFLLDGIQPGVYIARFSIGTKSYAQKVVVH